MNQQKYININYYIPPYKRNTSSNDADKDDNKDQDNHQDLINKDDNNKDNNQDNNKDLIDNSETKPLKIYKFNNTYLSNYIINKQYNISAYNCPSQIKTNSYILKNNHNIDDNIFNFKEDIMSNKLNDIIITKLSNNNYYIINIKNSLNTNYYTKHKIFVDIILNTIANTQSNKDESIIKIINETKEYIINNKDKQLNTLINQTPLMFAIYLGNYECTKILLNSIKTLDKNNNDVMYYYNSSLNKNIKIKELISNFIYYPDIIY